MEFDRHNLGVQSGRLFFKRTRRFSVSPSSCMTGVLGWAGRGWGGDKESSPSFLPASQVRSWLAGNGSAVCSLLHFNHLDDSPSFDPGRVYKPKIKLDARTVTQVQLSSAQQRRYFLLITA